MAGGSQHTAHRSSPSPREKTERFAMSDGEFLVVVGRVKNLEKGNEGGCIRTKWSKTRSSRRRGAFLMDEGSIGETCCGRMPGKWTRQRVIQGIAGPILMFCLRAHHLGFPWSGFFWSGVVLSCCRAVSGQDRGTILNRQLKCRRC